MLPVVATWAALIALSIFITGLFEWFRLPAALMLGPLVSAIVVVQGGGKVRMPRFGMNMAQATIGCMIARSFNIQIVDAFLAGWPLLIGLVLAIVGVAALLGWIISRLGIMQGTTAIWGVLPGAAPVMILMAEAYGADAQLVAFMQYFRVVLIAVTTSAVARYWTHSAGAAAHAVDLFPPLHWAAFWPTLVVMSISLLAALRPRVPAGVLLAAMTIGGVVHISGYAALELPPWLLTAGYAVLGWTTGSRFSKDVLAAAARALPQVLGSILALMAFAAGMAFVLVRAVGVDPLTAYLATSPGGLDSISIIAASTRVDTSFVMVLQTVRFVLIIAIGSRLSRFVAGLVDRSGKVLPKEARVAVQRGREADVGDLD